MILYDFVPVLLKYIEVLYIDVYSRWLEVVRLFKIAFGIFRVSPLYVSMLSMRWMYCLCFSPVTRTAEEDS